MFLLNMLNSNSKWTYITQAYTTRAVAECEAAMVVVREFLNNHPGTFAGHCLCDEEPIMHHKWDRAQFEQAFQQENYAECVQIWNRYCNGIYGTSRLRIDIREVLLDKPFGASK